MQNLVTVDALASGGVIDLGGRDSNVVTFSDNAKVGKGWRLLKLDGVGCGEGVAAALSAARPRSLAASQLVAAA